MPSFYIYNLNLFIYTLTCLLCQDNRGFKCEYSLINHGIHGIRGHLKATCLKPAFLINCGTIQKHKLKELFYKLFRVVRG